MKVTVGTCVCEACIDWLTILGAVAAPPRPDCSEDAFAASSRLVKEKSPLLPLIAALSSLCPICFRSAVATSSLFIVDLRRGFLWKVTFRTPMYLF